MTDATSGSRGRIVWHMGFQKTGTRTFQHLLRENAAGLKGDFVLRSKHLNCETLEKAGRRMCHPGRLLRHDRLRQFNLQRAVQPFAQEVSQHPKRLGLVSNENLIGPWMQYDGKTIFDYAELMVTRLGQICAGFQNEFVFTIRAFEPWLKSAWRQEVMTRRGRLELDAWEESLAFSLDWAEHLARLQEAAKRVDATVDFVESRPGTVIGDVILQRCGLSADRIAALEVPTDANIGAGPNATEFMLRVNRSNVSDKDRSILRGLIESNRTLFAD